jgi:Zn-dependent protease
MNVDPIQFACIAFIIFFAIGLHEYAHCKVADMAGDPTPRIYGRVTLNLTKHFDPMGTVMMFISALSGYGLGWGKPAPINPARMENPRWDTFAAVAAGPLTNFVQAIIYALPLRFMAANGSLDPTSVTTLFFTLGVTINLSLCFFNLIPLGPLDGHWLVGQLLPEKPQYYWYRFHRSTGRYGLLVLVLGSQFVMGSGGPNILAMIIGRPIAASFQALTGLHLS